jgi:hypothetical protein
MVSHVIFIQSGSFLLSHDIGKCNLEVHGIIVINHIVSNVLLCLPMKLCTTQNKNSDKNIHIKNTVLQIIDYSCIFFLFNKLVSLKH